MSSMLIYGNINRLSVAFFIFFATFGVITKAVNESESYCYALDENPYWSFGTSTVYEFVHSRKMDVPDHTACKPVYIGGFVRSGIRYYGDYDAKYLNELRTEIVNNHEMEKRGLLQPADLKTIKEWTSQGSGKNSDDPTPRGREESFNLGKRIAEQFKDLIASQSENFRFQTSSSLTVRESAVSFIAGMFGDSAKVDISQNDELLRYIEDSVEFYQEATLDASRKRKQCVESQPMQTLREEVSKRLGYQTPLTDDAIETMYYACAFEFAWNKDKKPAFCVPFTKPHLQVLEYCYYDVFGFYEWAYGSQHAEGQDSLVLNDLVKKIEAAASKPESPQFNGEFNFASGAALTHLVMKLGLYDDKELLPVDNPTPKKSYQWSMTKVCPFSGNVISVLQKCDKDDLRVSTYHNEQLVQIPGCSSVLCPWSDFKKALKVKSMP